MTFAERVLLVAAVGGLLFSLGRLIFIQLSAVGEMMPIALCGAL